MDNLQVTDELRIAASAARIWSIITNLELLPQINPNVLSVTGCCSGLGDERVVTLKSLKGGSGTVTERLVSWEPELLLCWRLEADTLGIGNYLGEPHFATRLIPIPNLENETLVRMEAAYTLKTPFARMFNDIDFIPNYHKAHQQILANISAIV